MICSDTFSRRTGKEVFLKLENLQKTGSFKTRGAYHKLSRFSPAMRKRGVIAASAGNHAQGVAYASSLLGISSTVVMPEGSSLAKQMATRSYGGEVILFGQDTDEALDHAKRLAEDGRSFIHPFDDEEIIAGQGTIGIEILEEVPDVEAIVVPVGGGGLISGIATIVKKRSPRVKIIGVQARHAPSSFYSLKKKRIVEVKAKPTLADGIAIRQPGEITFPIIRKGRWTLPWKKNGRPSDVDGEKRVAEGAGLPPGRPITKDGRSGDKIVLVQRRAIDVHLLGGYRKASRQEGSVSESS
jgi:threonine dehydratase